MNSSGTKNEDEVIIVSGFENIVIEGQKNSSNDSECTITDNKNYLYWYCDNLDSWLLKKKVNNNTKDSDIISINDYKDGKWIIDDNNKDVLIIYPPSKKDFWRKTYYEPLLLKDDGIFLYTPLYINTYYTISVTFQLNAICQFDQAGIIIRYDTKHWIKTGIEVVDNIPKLSCVITNDFSDWSTQTLHNNHHHTILSNIDSNKKVVHVKETHIRVHCRTNDFVIESKLGEEKEWEFVRIGHLDRQLKVINDTLDQHPTVQNAWNGPCPKNDNEFWAGIFACCPDNQQGGNAIFSNFHIIKGSTFDHHA